MYLDLVYAKANYLVSLGKNYKINVLTLCDVFQLDGVAIILIHIFKDGRGYNCNDLPLKIILISDVLSVVFPGVLQTNGENECHVQTIHQSTFSKLGCTN